MSFITTATGGKLNPVNCSPDDFNIYDIAAGVSKEARWSGQTLGNETYTVAQHSVLVSYMCEPEDALWGLLHDATEGLGLRDLARPVKNLPEFKFYRDIEDKLMRTVCSKFGLQEQMPASVKEADDRMAATEYRDLMPQVDWWTPEYVPYEFRIDHIWTPGVAKEWFIDRFNDLIGGQ